jgi:pSer/pThr/pTyr-binding forkhead associated (FHA) protein
VYVTREPWAQTETSGAFSDQGIGVDGESYVYPRFGCRVIGGPDAGRACEASGPELSIGSAAGNELELSDPTVSRHHCTIRVREHGFQVRDLGSTNGVWIGGVRVESGTLRPGTAMRLGSARVRFEVLIGQLREPLGEGRTGQLHGRSAPMRRLFARLPAIAATGSPVLIEGVAGTGKTAVARTIHQLGRQAGGPLVTIDCGGFPPERLDPARVAGSSGGTLLVEELGELDARGQRHLLALLERTTDLRVVATSGRDLRGDVNRGWFLAELYTRFHHARVPLPPLAERREDVPLLVGAFYRELAGTSDAEPPQELVSAMNRRPWAGNLRELRAAVITALAAGWP